MSSSLDPDEYFDLVLRDALPGGRRALPGPVALWRRWWRAAADELAARDARFELACRQGFVLGVEQLGEVGRTRGQARTLVRSGPWSVPHRGTVAVVDPRGATEGDVDPSERWAVRRRQHALAGAAVSLRNPGFVVAGTSAAIMHGLPTVAVPSAASLVAPLELGSHRRGKASLLPAQCTQWFGVDVTTVARTVVDVARCDRQEGIVVADAALRENCLRRRELDDVLAYEQGWCGVRAAREVVRLASPLAESPLESLTRLALHDSGFPPPEPQVVLTITGWRGPIRVDFVWPERRLILETDGRSKYSEEERWHEKRRAIALDRAGYQVERVVWADVMATWPATAAHLWTLLG